MTGERPQTIEREVLEPLNITFEDAPNPGALLDARAVVPATGEMVLR